MSSQHWWPLYPLYICKQEHLKMKFKRLRSELHADTRGARTFPFQHPLLDKIVFEHCCSPSGFNQLSTWTTLALLLQVHVELCIAEHEVARNGIFHIHLEQKWIHGDHFMRRILYPADWTSERAIQSLFTLAAMWSEIGKVSFSSSLESFNLKLKWLLRHKKTTSFGPLHYKHFAPYMENGVWKWSDYLNTSENKKAFQCQPNWKKRLGGYKYFWNDASAAIVSKILHCDKFFKLKVPGSYIENSDIIFFAPDVSPIYTELKKYYVL